MASKHNHDATIQQTRIMDIADEPMRMLPPIQGFEKLPVVSLEEAVKPLVQYVDKINEKVVESKENCTHPIKDGLSVDESASIRLYTMQWHPTDKCLYVVLNKTLRDEDREALKPWFLYLRLLIGSLLKIRSERRHIFRGVKLDLSKRYVKGERVTWWAFSSSTDSLETLRSSYFLGPTGDRTLFDIDSYSGVDIRQNSHYGTENEIVLLPATQFLVVASLDTGNGLHVIHLKEIEPKYPLRGTIPGTMPLEPYQETVMHQTRIMDIDDEPMRILPPIQGFEKLLVVSLEEAVKPLVRYMDQLNEKVIESKKKCTHPIKDGLSVDESASIRLYTMQWHPNDTCLYVALNKALRDENRETLKPWFLYLRLLIGSLSKIRSEPSHVFRGVNLDLSEKFVKGERVTWWAFNSCSDSLDVVKSFLGTTGDRTLFDIDSYSGVDIRQHSRYGTENEIILLPATQFVVVGHLDVGGGLHIIHLKEIAPKYPLIATIPGTKVVARKEIEPKPSPVTNKPPTPIGPLKKIDTSGRNSVLRRHIDPCANRSKVDLSKLKISDEDVQIVVEEALGEKKCTTLELRENQMTSAGISTLADAIRQNTSLEELNLSGSNLSDAGLYELVKELSNNETTTITRRLCFCIARIQEVDKAPIKTLDLSKNNIGDEGVRYLSEMIKGKRTLTTLYLNDNSIGNDGVKSLANVLCKPGVHLQKLYLQNNKRITDASVQVLLNMCKENQSLTTFWLTDCGLTSNGKQTLQDATPSEKNFYF